MRSIFLGSAALFVSAGIACAQTNMQAPAGGANSLSDMQPSMPSGSMEPHVQPKTHGHGLAMPEGAGPHEYLRMAQSGIAHHDRRLAASALSHAETRLLSRSVEAGSARPVDQSPAVLAIERARRALKSGDYATASQETDVALQAMESRQNMSAGAMDNDGDNDRDTKGLAPSVNSTSRAGDMSQNGGVSHDVGSSSPGGTYPGDGMVPSVNHTSRAGGMSPPTP
ncbi:hypothetical protein [Acidocella sp.]|uniref:hypothetical protein n=1 Tax=Acidocella sp. TaxID=50710 RepID=UPI00261D5EE5|nr:hypothetical protein [Acidocella sp.]